MTQGNLLYFLLYRCLCVFSCAQLLMTPWYVAYQAPLSMEFSRQEYWSGLPFPSPGDLPDPGIEPRSPALQADSLPSSLPERLRKCLVAQPCLILCNPKTVAPPGSSVMEFSWKEYWSGLPFPSPGDLPYPGMEHGFPAGRFFYHLIHQGGFNN